MLYVNPIMNSVEMYVPTIITVLITFLVIKGNGMNVSKWVWGIALIVNYFLISGLFLLWKSLSKISGVIDIWSYFFLGLTILLLGESLIISKLLRYSFLRFTNALGFDTTLTYISALSGVNKTSQIIVTLKDNTIYTCYNTTKYKSATIRSYICDKHGNIALYVESIKYPDGKEILLNPTTHGKTALDLLSLIPKEEIKLIQFNISRKNIKKSK